MLAMLTRCRATALQALPDEHEATRTLVSLDDGSCALAVRYATQRDAERVARVLGDPTLGGQLFALPELLHAELEERALLLSAPQGQPWRAPLSQLDAPHVLMESLGELVRKLHSITSPGYFGEIQPVDYQHESPLSSGAFHTFHGWVAERLERAASLLTSTPHLTEPERLAMRQTLGDLRHELSAFHPRQPAALHHGSLALEHLWVTPSHMQVVALTGFTRAAFLPPEADLAHLLWIDGLASQPEPILRAFYKGYGVARTMDMQRRERFYRRLLAIDILLPKLSNHPTRHDLATHTLLALTSPQVHPAFT